MMNPMIAISANNATTDIPLIIFVFILFKRDDHLMDRMHFKKQPSWGGPHSRQAKVGPKSPAVHTRSLTSWNI